MCVGGSELGFLMRQNSLILSLQTAEVCVGWPIRQKIIQLFALKQVPCFGGACLAILAVTTFPRDEVLWFLRQPSVKFAVDVFRKIFVKLLEHVRTTERFDPF